MTSQQQVVLKALTAYKVEQGLSAADAAAWAANHIQDALTRFRASLDDSGRGEAAAEKAFADLKVWARSEQ